MIEMNCKKHFFQQYDSNTLILHGTTLSSDHRDHSPWNRGVKVEEVGRGEGTDVELLTDVELVIVAIIMFVPW